MINPTAIVSPKSQIGPGAEIGPFCVIEPGAVIGAGCRLSAHVSIKSGVVMGPENTVEEGAVIGGIPQHLNCPERIGGVLIGRGNMIRENVTIHRALGEDAATTIGDDCLLMVGSHVAHDCVIGNNVVLTNNVMLGGHIVVQDRAYLGGGVAVHQFCHVGRLAMVGGMARVTQDVPPFVTIDGDTGMVVGLNRIGLRRAGLKIQEVAELKAAYQLIYRSGLPLEERLAALAVRFPTGPAAEFEPFIRSSARGFTRERRTPPGATIRPIHEEVADATVRVGKRHAG